LKALTFAILSIGDELMEGRHVDRNAAALSRRLTERGFEPLEHLTLPDAEAAIRAGLSRLAERVDVIVSTGGLGPTLDDMTRSAAAAAAGVALVRSEPAEVELRARFEAMGREMAASNLRQVDFPAGARPLANPWGTAPGFELCLGRARYFALPGPPREMGPMFDEAVAPALAAAGLVVETPARQSFYLSAQSESVFAEDVQAAGDWMAPDADPRMGVTAGAGILSVELVARTADAAGSARLARRAAAFRERFSRWIFSETEKDPAALLAHELIEAGVSVALAESCTGGRLAASLCAHAGVSAVFERGWVTYSNAAKEAELGVPGALLAAHGAVSVEVAGAMARGAAERAGARLALGVTGISGPGGGSDDKPVGLVCFGLSVDGEVETFESRFPSAERERVQTWAETAGLLTLLRGLRRITG
jgi:nicotinamide-nucleotide amidase